ncbi:MAG: manno-octulosonate cytidylyltransferase [Bacteroidales bacterium]
MNKILIVIPARYASTRLPGKPLVKIAGVEMIKRVAKIAQYVANKTENCSYVVATDNNSIIDFCTAENIPAVMTAESCKSGTERCWDAINQQSERPNFVINLQGDNPLCPPWFIEQLIQAWQEDNTGELFTPALHLSWSEFDSMREAKKTTPFSGTCVEVDKFGYALTFSKSLIPTIRKEEKLRTILDKSPVRRHIGLYAYTYNALERYFNDEPSPYELPEGLEQMRFLHNRIPVKIVEVDYNGRKSMSGVDSPEDIQRAEEIIAEFGEFDLRRVLK